MFPFDPPLRTRITPDRLPGLAAWYDASDSATVLTQVGGATAFASASSQFLTSSNASLKKGDTDYTISGWVNIASVSAGTETFFGAWDFSGNQRGYRLDRSGATLRWQVSSNGTAFVFVVSSTITTGWVFFVCEYNAAADTASIFVNNGAPVSAACSVGFTSTANFFMGAANGTADFANSRLDEITFHDRLLISDERTWLYNSGQGRTYSEADASLKTNLVSWWSMNAPASGDWLDSHGSNNLTPSVSRPTATEGVTFNPATEGQTVRRWLDRSGNGRHADQTTLLNQPTLSGGLLAFTNQWLDLSLSGGVFRNKSQGYIFAVARTTTPASGDISQVIVGYSTATGTALRLGLLSRVSSSANFSTLARRQDGDSAGFANSTNNSNTNILEARANYAAGTIRIGVNGVLSATTALAGGAGTSSDTDSANSRIANFGVTDRFTGTINEILVVNEPLSESEISKLRQYLARKWGVSL